MSINCVGKGEGMFFCEYGVGMFEGIMGMFFWNVLFVIEGGGMFFLLVVIFRMLINEGGMFLIE